MEWFFFFHKPKEKILENEGGLPASTLRGKQPRHSHSHPKQEGEVKISNLDLSEN